MKASQISYAILISFIVGIVILFFSGFRFTHQVEITQKQTSMEGKVVSVSKQALLTQVTVRSDALGMNVLVRSTFVGDAGHGDTVRCFGTLAGLSDDSYGNYLKSQRVDAILDKATLKIVRMGNPWNVFRMLEASKNRTEQTIMHVFPEPHASLVIGLITGSRGTLSDTVIQNFKSAGLTHILAISGYNITMILTVLSVLLCWVPLRFRIIPSVLFLVSFTLFTGAGASVVRACIMGILGQCALTLGRPQTMRLTVLWALAAMVAWNPLALFADAGFQLSYLALIGIMEFGPLIEPWTKRFCTERFGIEEGLRTTLSAQVLTTPWIALLFGRVSLIAPLSNLIVLPAVPFATLLGFGALLGGFLSPTLGRILSFTVTPFTGWILGCAEVLAHLPFASIDWQLGTVTAIGIYGALFVWWYRSQNNHDRHT